MMVAIATKLYCFTGQSFIPAGIRVQCFNGYVCDPAMRTVDATLSTGVNNPCCTIADLEPRTYQLDTGECRSCSGEVLDYIANS